MLTISRPLSAAQVRTYHAQEFSNARENYYTRGDTIRGQWHGQLATRWGLSGDVREEHVERLADGRHPITGERIVRHQTPRPYVNARGETVTPVAHRAAWDATFSAPKSVSLTALVGGDARVRAAHQASVRVALDAMEPYVQARLGRNLLAETTGQWVAATFEHDSARPVEGYAAPQLHTHVVVFNVTERPNGRTRALQPRELYKTQPYATAVYRAELATRLIALGYELERGPSGQPDISGYTPEYLEASSPRRQQIQDHLTHAGYRGAAAAQIAAHRTREAKRDVSAVSHDEMQRRHAALAEAYGHQPARVIQAARDHAARLEPHLPRITAHEAVTFAKARNFEREAVVDERALRGDAYSRAMGEVTVGAIAAAFEQRVAAGEFIGRAQPPGIPGRAFTTREMIELEAQSIQIMRAGRQTQPALVREGMGWDIQDPYARLSEAQRAAVDHIFASRDQVMALEGVAGGGKTTALAVVRDRAERAGYRVEGFAPTSRAAQQLAEAGLSTSTLQYHLMRHAENPGNSRRLYVLDESSLASTRQMHAFLERLTPRDRVLLVGDVRQHQAVDAGRPYQQLQEAGLDTARLDDIVRQQDPALKAVVERLSRGEVRDAIQQLDTQGRVHEIPDRDTRLTAMARAYAGDPDRTLVVSPDNHSRMEINHRIHAWMQTIGRVDVVEHHVRVLVPRQEITGADRQWAQQYQQGDVVRYTTGSKVLGLSAGTYARIHAVNASANLLTVRRTTGELVTYDPRRLQGVTLYRETDRAFAKGDRLQVTAPYRERGVANRELGTLEQIDASGHLRLRLDSGRRVAFTLEAHPHLDYGYAVTSHSSQGQTADRVVVHVDTAVAGEQLVNRRLAYVAVSRGRYDAQIYTNDKAQLGEALSREVSHRSALEPGRVPASPTRAVEPSAAQRHAPERTIAR
jgi:conjugative relaxase-like TrwC/TraI family protein